MKKMGKLLALLLCVVMCVGCLTGCMGAIADIQVNEDGSVDVVARMGMTEEGIKMAQESDLGSDMGDTTFEYNGVTYYGEVENQHYDSIDDFNAEWSQGVETNDSEILSLVQTDDGFKLTINAYQTKEFVNVYKGAFNADETSEIDAATMEEILKTMVYVLKFNFPYPVEIQWGSSPAITVDGNTVTFDIMQMGSLASDVIIVSSKNISGTSIDEEQKKLEEAKKQAELEKAKVELEKQKAELDLEIGRIIFEDVPDGAWYRDAVYALAESGLVRGVGAGKFDPSASLTFAQFCQILANAEGLPTGEVNGYWAYKAIESCRNKGYIIDLGAYTPANYDVPMPREAAIAGMFRAKATELYTAGKVGNTIKLEDIPDYMFIDDNYKNDIVDAYNSGITKGIDEKGTCGATLILSRCEICQLFVNAGFVK